MFYLFALADFKESVESGIWLVTFYQHLFTGLKEVDEWRIGSNQVFGIFQVHAADGKVVRPVLKCLQKN